jgi:hypothetical protein
MPVVGAVVLVDFLQLIRNLVLAAQAVVEMVLLLPAWLELQILAAAVVVDTFRQTQVALAVPAS